MAGTPQEQAKLARRWLRDDDPEWSEFTQRWMAFNALYDTVRQPNQPEADAIHRTVIKYFDQNTAGRCLKKIDQRDVRALFRVPPGDCRYASGDPRFRRMTSQLVATFGASADDIERLSCLMRVVYQVRCNLVHGSKDPAIRRDQRLVSVCTPIVDVVVRELIRLMK